MDPGAFIGVIMPGGPACQELILRVGDRIVSLDGKECADMAFSVRYPDPASEPGPASLLAPAHHQVGC